jgi:cytochrome d ubiquinol oxidase subunit I
VTIASHVSAFWILAANSFMQHPVGYTIRNGRAELTDFLAVITQPYLFHQLIHTLSGAALLGAFFVMGVSAWHMMRGSQTAFFRRSFKLAAYFALFFSVVEVVQGHMNGALVAEHQPAKLAAMESLWESGAGRVPQTVLLFPDEARERNYFELVKLPGALSLLAYHRLNAPVRGLKEWPKEERPPVLLSFLSFRTMIALGFLFPVLGLLGVVLGFKDSGLARLPGIGTVIAYFDRVPGLLWIFVLAIPLPYIAIACGWCLTEVGRQPWLVYGVMKTAEGVSEIGRSQVIFSLLGFLALYIALGIADFILLMKAARRGPKPEAGEIYA